MLSMYTAWSMMPRITRKRSLRFSHVWVFVDGDVVVVAVVNC